MNALHAAQKLRAACDPLRTPGSHFARGVAFLISRADSDSRRLQASCARRLAPPRRRTGPARRRLPRRRPRAIATARRQTRGAARRMPPSRRRALRRRLPLLWRSRRRPLPAATQRGQVRRPRWCFTHCLPRCSLLLTRDDAFTQTLIILKTKTMRSTCLFAAPLRLMHKPTHNQTHTRSKSVDTQSGSAQ